MTAQIILDWRDNQGPSAAALTGDAVSELLGQLRLSTWISGPMEHRGAFGVRYHERSVGLMLITKGRAVVTSSAVDDGRWRWADPGTLVLWFSGAGLEVRDRPESPLAESSMISRQDLRTRSRKRIGEGPVSFESIASALRFDSQAAASVIGSLPRMLMMSTGDNPRLQDSARVLERYAEDDAPGSGAFLNAVVQALVVEMMRCGLERADDGSHAAVDPHIGPALAVMHADLSHPWSIEALALEAGLSRSVFCETFRETVGCPPGKYLREARLKRAAELLDATNFDVTDIGRRVGYSSEGAFCTAFRTWKGMTPTEYRRRAS